jgi:hypothetical protein
MSIESGDFLGLSKLTLLFVCVNWVPLMCDSRFPCFLTCRDLSSNKISSFEKGDFADLGKLEGLFVCL